MKLADIPVNIRGPCKSTLTVSVTNTIFLQCFLYPVIAYHLCLYDRPCDDKVNHLRQTISLTRQVRQVRSRRAD
jgi:hypothetical protein